MGQHILRLKRRPEFLRVASTRKKWAAPGLILQVRAHPADGKPHRAPCRTPGRADDVLRVGFTVSKKVGNSVARNRAKRRLRALCDEILPTHAKSGFDIVLIGRRATINRPWAKLVDDLLKALDKMGIAQRSEQSSGTGQQDVTEDRQGRTPA